MLGARPVDTLIDLNVKLSSHEDEPIEDIDQYRRLEGKLIYVTLTRPDILFKLW